MEAQQYKSEGKIDKTFEEMGVVPVCIGGCDSIKHWTALNIIKQLNKPFFILLDSDKKTEEEVSPNFQKLTNIGFTSDDFQVTRKREIENYIPSSYFFSLAEPIVDINYSDWDDDDDLPFSGFQMRPWY